MLMLLGYPLIYRARTERQSVEALAPGHSVGRPAISGALALSKDLQTAAEVKVVVGSLDPWSTLRVGVCA
jgi:hypothetical protein